MNPLKEKAMLCNPMDGCCRNCGGALEFIDTDAGLKTVVCLDCGASSVIDIDTEHTAESPPEGGGQARA